MMNIKKHARTAGFTLIELLVVIAIIGILSAVVLASLNSARQKGRDAARVSDVKQLQLALELYYDANQSYPTSIGTSASSPLITGQYIESIPVDPQTGNAYAYSALTSSAGAGTACTSGTCASFVIGAALESSSNSVLANSNHTINVTGVDCTAATEYCVTP